MSISLNSPSSFPSRQRDLHINVEQQGLSLGAARERKLRAASVSHERERQLDAAIDEWENEGGTASGVALPSTPDLLRRLTTLQLSADLFRDDTMTRAVILNGLLLFIAGTVSIVLLNN